MTNEQLTWAFSSLVGFIIGHVITQWKTNRIVEKRFEGHKKAFELICDNLDNANAKNRALLEAVTEKLEAIMVSISRSRKPPGT